MGGISVGRVAHLSFSEGRFINASTFSTLAQCQTRNVPNKPLSNSTLPVRRSLRGILQVLMPGLRPELIGSEPLGWGSEQQDLPNQTSLIPVSGEAANDPSDGVGPGRLLTPLRKGGDRRVELSRSGQLLGRCPLCRGIAVTGERPGPRPQRLTVRLGWGLGVSVTLKPQSDFKGSQGRDQAGSC